MIRTKSLGYVLLKYALGVALFLILTLIAWGLLTIGAALVGHQAPAYGTASDVTFVVLLVVFIYGEVSDEIERRRARRDGWTPVN